MRNTILCLALVPGLAWAQTTPSPEIPTAQPQTVWFGSPIYPKELASRGVQGQVIIKADLSAEGKFSNAAVYETSGSPELDQIAVKLVSGAKIRPTPETAKHPTLLLPINFVKDTSQTVLSKTCADLVVDYDYYMTTPGAKRASRMSVFNLLSGYLVVGIPGALGNLDFIRSLASAADRTVEQCRAHPDANFANTYKSNIKIK